MYFTEMSFSTKEKVLEYYKNLPDTLDSGLTDWGIYRTYNDSQGLQIELIHAKLEYNQYWVKAYYTDQIEAQRLTKGIPLYILESLAAPKGHLDSRWLNIALIIN